MCERMDLIPYFPSRCGSWSQWSIQNGVRTHTLWEWKKCENIDMCVHINHLGTRLCVQLWGTTEKLCVCVWVCAGIQAWEVAVYNVCVLTGLPCVQLHPELPSSHWAAPEYFLYQPSLPLSFFALLAQSDPIRLLFTAALWDTSTFSSYHPCSFFLFLLRNVSKHQIDGMTSQDLKCDYFENYGSLFCMFFPQFLTI